MWCQDRIVILMDILIVTINNFIKDTKSLLRKPMFIQNIFSESELTIIHNNLEQELQKNDWFTWSKEKVDIISANATKITKDSYYPTEQGTITFKHVNEVIKGIVRQKLISIDPDIRGYDFVAYYQIWDIGSGTGSHTDSGFKFNATFYLNKKWEADDGGLYVYLDKDDYKVYVPKYNSCAYINQSMLEEHLVTPITNNAKEKRMTIHCKAIVK
jgi:hypothetical protein